MSSRTNEFNGSEGGFITPEQGGEMTKAYRESCKGESQIIKARFLGKDKLLEILNNPECMGLRIYFARDASGQMDIVTVGADADMNDMLDKVLDLSWPCPPRCSTANVLNS